MKTKIIRITVLTIAVVMISLNLSLNLKNDLSDISLVNMEALASEDPHEWWTHHVTGYIEVNGYVMLCCLFSVPTDACDFNATECVSV